MSLCDESPPDGPKFTDLAGAESPRDIEEQRLDQLDEVAEKSLLKTGLMMRSSTRGISLQ
jgi:hypothetical protein